MYIYGDILEYFYGLFLALSLGIMTSISPCPLATNIAAISYISKNLNAKSVFISGLLYTLGRMFAYIIVSFVILFGLSNNVTLSNFLQEKIIVYIGPVLIIAGGFLLDLLTLNFGMNNKINFKKFGIMTEFIFGFLFALSFCPVSAALFFLNLIPLCIKNNSIIAYPVLYGIGTAIPVLIFSIVLSYSTKLLSKVFTKITVVEKYIRKIFGIVLIVTGIYLTVVYTFELL